MNMFSVSHPALDDSRRIIVISDIHGNLAYFDGLLAKLHLRSDDQLILLGDLVEKGPESLATLRRCMSLARRCRLYPVMGNCDFWHLWVDADGAVPEDPTVAHLLHQKATARQGLILNMCDQLGVDLRPDTDIPALKAALRENFQPEFDFLRSIPFALETDKYIFGPWRCMKLDNFYADRPHFQKWVVTGHTPVCLYGRNIISAAPIVDRACRVISIDGGCVLKDDGQLNALIIRRGRFSWEWYDGFPLARALEGQKKSRRCAYIRWGDNQVEPLELGRDWCTVRHLRTGYVMDVPTDFLFEDHSQLYVNDVTDYRPAIAPGDVLSVVRETDRGYWVKINGVTGWYDGEIEYMK